MKPEIKETYYINGGIESQLWVLNEKLHREDGPARIWYREGGSVAVQSWYLNGKYHREDGPARIWYNQDGSIYYQEWRLNGKELTKQDFDSLDMIKRMNAFPLFTVKEIARMKVKEYGS